MPGWLSLLRFRMAVSVPRLGFRAQFSGSGLDLASGRGYGRPGPLDLAGPDHAGRHELCSALGGAAGPEEAAPHPPDDNHLGAGIQGGRRRWSVEPGDGDRLGRPVWPGDGHLEGEQAITGRQHPVLGRAGQNSL